MARFSRTQDPPPVGRPLQEQGLERHMKGSLRRAWKKLEALTGRLADAERRIGELEERLAHAEEREPGSPQPDQVAEPITPPGDDGAHVVAARMVHAGYADEDVERYLREVFDIPDAHAVVEEARVGDD
jgi:hypothetical protein